MPRRSTPDTFDADAYAADVRRRGDTIQVTVPDDYDGGERLDKYLVRFYPESSRTKIQRSIKKGQVLVNGADVQKSRPVEAGDEIVCRLVQPPPVKAEPEPIDLDILHEDDDVIVVNKPAGMVVHPAHGHRSGTLVNALLHHVGGDTVRPDFEEEGGDPDDEDVGLSMVGALPERPGNPVIRPGIVHRLDKGTSGVLVVAKHDRAHRFLADQFREHDVDRRYLGLCWGHLDPPEGTIEGAIGRDPRNRKRMAVVPEADGKWAITHYETVERLAHTSVVTFRLETGRTHQIRVHCADRERPLLADEQYSGRAVRYGPHGRKRAKFFERIFEALGRPALHAADLGFVHPGTREKVHFHADPPGDWQHALQRLRTVEGGA
jgi:23S rRNA pseudouridine1911/1915/1917 synthase